MISRIDHVAVAVKDYKKAADFFQGVLGAVAGASGDTPGANFFWCNHVLGDLTRLELLTPTQEGGLLDNFLKDREGGVHHVTLETPDIEEMKKTLDEKGILYFGANEYPGGVWKEIFIHPRHAFGVLIQIAEFEADDWIAGTMKFPAGERWSVEKTGEGAAATFAHPGGGKARIELKKDEVEKLIRDLEHALE